ncbi:hypothetical protein NEOC65_000634 [Neochlamydia sp. AcF65]|nr:hypothetical protein [Neochlamydia sp. AcF65]MBS4169592.1 hypothetical protein [Neochlamydia sp. AcF95]
MVGSFAVLSGAYLACVPCPSKSSLFCKAIKLFKKGRGGMRSFLERIP